MLESAQPCEREVDPGAEVTVVVSDSFPNYSICGLPFYLSGEVPDWHWLAHRTAEEITGVGVYLLLDHTAQVIDPVEHVVTVVAHSGQADRLRYDRLVIATRAVPVRPPIAGLDLPGVYLLRSMEDSFAVHTHLEAQAPRSAVIIGGGYIGLEMADALTHRGLSVTVVEHGASVLKNFDTSLGQHVAAEVRRHGVQVVSGVGIEDIVQEGSQLRVGGSEGFSTSTDLVLIGVGVQPVTDLAQSAGVMLGVRHAIRVSRAMETNVPNTYAAGDCVETWHHLLGRTTYLPLGTTAHKQCRQASIRSPSSPRAGTTKCITQVRTNCASVSREIARRVACWGHKCSGIGMGKWPSGSTSLPRPCFRACSSMTSMPL